ILDAPICHSMPVDWGHEIQTKGGLRELTRHRRLGCPSHGLISTEKRNLPCRTEAVGPNGALGWQPIALKARIRPVGGHGDRGFLPRRRKIQSDAAIEAQLKPKARLFNGEWRVDRSMDSALCIETTGSRNEAVICAVPSQRGAILDGSCIC